MDAVVYCYLAVVWMHSLGGIAVEILGRWTYGYGEGSATEAIGAAVRAKVGDPLGGAERQLERFLGAPCCGCRDWIVPLLRFPVSSCSVL